MKVINTTINKLNNIDENLIVLLGKFDGIHKGHKELINIAKEESKVNDSKLAVLCFHPHPNNLYKNVITKELSTPREKEYKLRKLNIDYLIIIKFDITLASMTPTDFMNVLKDKLNIKTIVVGEDYRFGKGALGTIKDLEKEFNVKPACEVMLDNSRISSTRIREALSENKFSLIKDMLGSDYLLQGEIIHGLKLGRTIGYPTANIKINENKLYPLNGTYKGTVLVKDKVYKTMINIGNNPTISDNKDLKLEIHIKDFNETIYGEEVIVCISSKIRDEIKFDNINELKLQLEKDKSLL